MVSLSNGLSKQIRMHFDKNKMNSEDLRTWVAKSRDPWYLKDRRHPYQSQRDSLSGTRLR